MCLEERYSLYEEALTIYKKLEMNIEAIHVLINNLNDLERAEDFAEKISQPDVWSKLG